ncbi:MAG: MFS transporter, partial [Chloroflexi bacterium]|nr:MFS transporter [Chloroflexota bacterium]
ALVVRVPTLLGVAPYLFALVFLMSGFSEGGRGIVFSAYLLDVTPDDERPLYIGLMNSFLGVGALSPLVGGVLVDRLGYAPVFGLVAGFLVAGALLSLGLRQPSWTPPAEEEEGDAAEAATP